MRGLFLFTVIVGLISKLACANTSYSYDAWRHLSSVKSTNPSIEQYFFHDALGQLTTSLPLISPYHPGLTATAPLNEAVVDYSTVQFRWHFSSKSQAPLAPSVFNFYLGHTSIPSLYQTGIAASDFTPGFLSTTKPLYWRVEQISADGKKETTKTRLIYPLDTDQDGIFDHIESLGCLDPTKADTDGDGLSDHLEDQNQNGRVDRDETSGCLYDTDGDGIDDRFELANQLNPLDEVDGSEDRDQDGFTNAEEYFADTDLDNAAEMPTGVWETFAANETGEHLNTLFFWESLGGEHNPTKDFRAVDIPVFSAPFAVYNKVDPRNGDAIEIATEFVSEGGVFIAHMRRAVSNGNQLLEILVNETVVKTWTDIYDSRFERLSFFVPKGRVRVAFRYTNFSKYKAYKLYLDDVFIPAVADSNGDGLKDGFTLHYFDALSTDPLADADNDGLSNQAEHDLKTNPLDQDSDRDGMSDGYEASYALNPDDMRDSAGDLDADRFFNVEEYFADTDPTDASSFPTHLDDFENDTVQVSILPTTDEIRSRQAWSALPESIYPENGLEAHNQYAWQTLQRSRGEQEVTAIFTAEKPFIAFDLAAELDRYTGLSIRIDDEDVFYERGSQKRKRVYFPLSLGKHTMTLRYYDSADVPPQQQFVLDNINWPGNPDTDSDGIDDSYEWFYFDSLDENHTTDHDSDGLDLAAEYANRGDPKNSDTDGDRLLDGTEVLTGSDLNVPNAETLDTDLDGFSDLEEQLYGSSPISNASLPVGSLEDFETGEFDTFYWYKPSSSSKPFVITNDFSEPLNLALCRPLPLDNYQQRKIRTSVYMTKPGFIRIPFKTSSREAQVNLSIHHLPTGKTETLYFKFDTIPFIEQIQAPLETGANHITISYSPAKKDHAICFDNIFVSTLSDTDDDGIKDGWEIRYFGRLDFDNQSDYDGDGSTNSEEYFAGTDPKDVDTDNDSLRDGYEIRHGLNPLARDTHLDLDQDGFSNGYEAEMSTLPNDAISQPDATRITFDSGELTPFTWQNDAEKPWQFHELENDNQCIRSAPVSLDDEQTTVQVAFSTDKTAYLSFDYWLASSGYAEKFKVYLGNSLIHSNYGEVTGRQHVIKRLYSGDHVLKFRFELSRDAVLEDPHVCIDNLTVPTTEGVSQ